MKVGDLVKLEGTMYSSYEYQGEVGLLLEFVNLARVSGYPEAEYGKVMWARDNNITSVKIKHLEAVDENYRSSRS